MNQKIIFDNVTLKYQLPSRVLTVFENLNLEINPEEFTMLVGKSGCGKTSLLRLLSGLEKPTSGRIIIPENLQLGFVFQESRLMNWLSVEKNISLGLKNPDKSKIKDIISLVGLNGFEKALPHQLSGGMQQRVSLARTLIRDSNLILMDEPFAALDNFTRQSMQQELLKIRSERKIGIIFVTHDINEATFLGERIITVHSGTTGEGLQI